MHLLRHSFATRFLESYIQKLLAQKNFCAIKETPVFMNTKKSLALNLSAKEKIKKDEMKKIYTAHIKEIAGHLNIGFLSRKNPCFLSETF